MIRPASLLSAALLWLGSLAVMAQQVPDNLSTHAIMVGMGRVHQLDTYLSPMEYRGPQLSLLRETLRMTHWADNRVSHQSFISAAFSLSENPAGNANEWGGHIGYQAGWHYHWTPLSRLRIMAGALIGAQAGALYNTRNGNNPAQARLNIGVAASAAAIYKLPFKRFPIALRYQADFPLAGCMFSPHFGESYYEISQNGVAGNLIMSHPANALSLRQMFTADFPFRRITLRAGYMSDIRQSDVRHIQTHDIGRSFLIGFVRNFTIMRKAAHSSSNTIL